MKKKNNELAKKKERSAWYEIALHQRNACSLFFVNLQSVAMRKKNDQTTSFKKIYPLHWVFRT